jgi:hypothetical protein
MLIKDVIKCQLKLNYIIDDLSDLAKPQDGMYDETSLTAVIKLFKTTYDLRFLVTFINSDVNESSSYRYLLNLLDFIL